MPSVDPVRIGALKSLQAFKDHLQSLGIDFPVEAEVETAPASPLAQPLEVFGKRAPNRFAIQPMEGWDATAEGRPSELTVRRWQRFGLSGAGLIWGGEAVAVRSDGRANPHQLVLSEENLPAVDALRQTLREHISEAGTDPDTVPVGLQLTHSGRFARPHSREKPEPKILYPHPLLNAKFGLPMDYPVLTDDALQQLRDDFIAGGVRAWRAGFDFVDIKHCHGYLGHELLSAHTRPGAYGGSLANRTRFLREVVEGLRSAAPGLHIGVRLSAFDLTPFHPDPEQSVPGRLGPGLPDTYCHAMPYRYAFGADQDQPTELDLSEPLALFGILRELGIRVVNVTAGSPYYNPHIQRPAFYPPSDGYAPPEDPLIGVARQAAVVRFLKQQNPDFVLVGSAYSYLQDYLPNVAQGLVRQGWVDFAGLGRMVLSYPELPRDVLQGRTLDHRKVCRTFSDCTTAPRNGLVSGCYPLDEMYKHSPEAAELAAVKRAAKG
jgi:2,4-dienoyl-CoA reductase-like NADH-dependent reductase (Old Yellow Enzyme family)